MSVFINQIKREHSVIKRGLLFQMLRVNISNYYSHWGNSGYKLGNRWAWCGHRVFLLLFTVCLVSLFGPCFLGLAIVNRLWCNSFQGFSSLYFFFKGSVSVSFFGNPWELVCLGACVPRYLYAWLILKFGYLFFQHTKGFLILMVM